MLVSQGRRMPGFTGGWCTRSKLRGWAGDDLWCVKCHIMHWWFPTCHAMTSGTGERATGTDFSFGCYINTLLIQKINIVFTLNKSLIIFAIVICNIF